VVGSEEQINVQIQPANRIMNTADIDQQENIEPVLDTNLDNIENTISNLDTHQ